MPEIKSKQSFVKRNDFFVIVDYFLLSLYFPRERAAGKKIGAIKLFKVCVFSYLAKHASEVTLLDTDLSAFFFKPQLVGTRTTKVVRSVSKQGHLQPHCQTPGH